MNYYASRAHQPLDGTYGNTRFNSNDVNYVEGNLEYLNDRRTRDNKLYFASANKYNQVRYQIANDYMVNYQKFVKIDAQELENKIIDEQLGLDKKELTRQMETGTLPVRPLRGNVEILQELNNEKKKIAVPDYISEYLDIYTKDETNEKEDEMLLWNGDKEYFAEYTIRDRDDYIIRYLYAIDKYNDDNKIKYQERLLEQ